MRERSGPESLWLVRHGESAGNVARQRAWEQGAAVIDIEQRDVDVPLSPLGERQAAALGRELRTVPESELPTAVLSSPYVRAQQTAVITLETCGGPLARVPVVTDERLRDRDFGVLDRLTRRGIAERYPEQARLRARFGKFYHRPPGGEAWTDVLLRLRSVVDTLARDYDRQRVVIFTHDVVVVCFRYLYEHLTEQQVLELSEQNPIANCSLSAYDLTGASPLLTRFNTVAPLADGSADGSAPVTTERGADVRP